MNFLNNYLKNDKIFESTTKFFVLLVLSVAVFYFVFRYIIHYFNLD